MEYVQHGGTDAFGRCNVHNVVEHLHNASAFQMESSALSAILVVQVSHEELDHRIGILSLVCRVKKRDC